MSKRVCSQPGCPELVDKAGKCPTHKAQAEKARGSSTARGYDYHHQMHRLTWKARVETGQVHCSRCDQRIKPDEPWDLDHTDTRDGYLGPSHAACNRAAPRVHKVAE